MLEPHQLRDCQAWKDDNLELSTTSNEAAKLFDSALHQMVGWYEDEKNGGVTGTLKKLYEADPNFIMGKVFHIAADLIGTGKTIRKDQEIADELRNLQCNVEKWKISTRERLHVRALQEWANGHLLQATRTWEKILVESPRDPLALKLSNDTYFYLGRPQMIRDSIARVLPEYKKSSTYYGYVKGMYAFGLEEMNLYNQAQENAFEALSINKHDAWAAHALTHTYEMQGLNTEGEHFLKNTNDDWLVCSFLAVHMYWHWCLMLIEEGRYDEVLGLYDSIMHPRAMSGQSMLDVVDMTSLLYRLELEGVNVGDRWQDIYEICKPHMDDHILLFNDVHILMSICGLKKSELAEAHLKSVNQFMDACDDDQAKITRDLGIRALEAIKAYSWGDYDKVVDVLLPVKDTLIGIGGSHAQRDIFNQLLVRAAMNSQNPYNGKLARSLLYERKAQKPNSPLTDRLLAKLMSCHVLNDSRT